MASTAAVRKNMVNCQLQTSGVVSEAILGAFEAVPREQFLPPGLQAAAYVDEDIILPSGGFLIEPLVLGRLFQAAQPKPGDHILTVGDTTGYVAALLSRLGAGAVRYEDPGHRQGKYSLVLIAGAVAEIPPALAGLLADGGRLVGVLRESERKAGTIILLEKQARDIQGVRRLYDSSTPYLKGFEPKSSFSF